MSDVVRRVVKMFVPGPPGNDYRFQNNDDFLFQNNEDYFFN